jgi:hypothetical protein
MERRSPFVGGASVVQTGQIGEGLAAEKCCFAALFGALRLIWQTQKFHLNTAHSGTIEHMTALARVTTQVCHDFLVEISIGFSRGGQRGFFWLSGF